MNTERRKPLEKGKEVFLPEEEGGELKLTVERVICYNKDSISYIGEIAGIEDSFSQKVVIKEFYPANESENGISREQGTGRLIVPDDRKEKFISRGRALFKKETPFTGVVEDNGTLYTYTDPNEIITLREWKESGGQLAGKEIAAIIVAAHLF